MQHLTQRYCISYILTKHPPVQRFFDLSHTHTHTHSTFSPSSSSHLSISLSFFFLGWERWHLVTMATALWCDHGLIFLLTSVWSDISALLCRAKTGQCLQPPSWNKNQKHTHKKNSKRWNERESVEMMVRRDEKKVQGGKKRAENNTDGIKMKRKQEVERGAWAKKQEELRNSGKETEKDIE